MKENTVNRNYKDRLFRLVFQKKKDLLQLYNAVNGTEYTNEKDLVINTLEDVVYLHMKNDLSFLFGGYQAVDRCIEENILKDILTKNRAEVTNMVLTEYDEERHIANEKKLSREEGRALNLISLIRRKVQKGQSATEIADDLLESPELIKVIFNIIKSNPQMDEADVYKEWKNQDN